MEDYEARQRALAFADFSPDGLLPEHLHHVDRIGMGGRKDASDLRTIGVSAQLHYRIHQEGDGVLGGLPERPALESIFC